MSKQDKSTKKVSTLKKIFEGKSSLLIVMQNNPDPDSIAAALALRLLANKTASLSCSIAHGGSVGRAENRAMVRYLSINLRQIDTLDISRFDLIAMVDTQPGSGNNSLPQNLVPDIVIDHHPCRQKTRTTRFIDVRSKYGATSTILFEYIQASKLQIETPLATAMVYAIRSDTQDLGTEASKADITAIQALYPLANLKMLSDIQRGRVEREYFKLLSRGISNAVAYDNCIITNLEKIDNADMIAEIADLLLRDDKALWTLCYAYCGQQILLSLRGSQSDKKAGDIMKHIVSRYGTGGGHKTMAGGQITIKKDTKSYLKKLEDTILKRFLSQVGSNGSTAEKLI